MIQNIPIENVLFLDIETVPAFADWKDLDPIGQKLFDKKTSYKRTEDCAIEEFYSTHAGLYAEFGKIVCISVGQIREGKWSVKSFSGHDEKKIMDNFGDLFNHPRLRNVILCAHNGKEFDFPWIGRKFLLHGMQPPLPFQLFGKKPWEIPHIDTMELWKFGEFRSSVSLELLAHVFGIPTPKDDIDGSMVSSIYHIDKDLFRIVKYCEKDVLTLANIFLRMRQENLLNTTEPL